MYIDGGGPLCRVDMGTSISIGATIVPNTFLPPFVPSSATNFPLCSLDNHRDVIVFATSISNGNDDRTDPSSFDGRNPNLGTVGLRGGGI